MLHVPFYFAPPFYSFPIVFYAGDDNHDDYVVFGFSEVRKKIFKKSCMQLVEKKTLFIIMRSLNLFFVAK